MTVHESAIIHKSAKLGKGVIVDPYTVIKEGVVIGDRTHIHSHCVIEYTEIGEDCEIYPYASIGLAAQHLQYKNEPSKVVIGNKTTLREGVTVHRGTPFDKSVTIIGDNCYFMTGSHVAHDCKIGNRVIVANHAQIAGHVEIADDCFISTLLGIHQWVRIGRGVMISGGSMVGADVAPFCNVQGDRASIRGLNLVGMKRMGLKRDDIKSLKAAYLTFFKSGLKNSEAFKHANLNKNNIYVNTFRDFLLQAVNSKRGYLKTESKAKTKEPISS